MTEAQENYKRKIIKDFKKSIETKKDLIEIWNDPYEATDEEIKEFAQKIIEGEKEIKEIEELIKNDNFDEMVKYHKKHWANAFYG